MPGGFTNSSAVGVSANGGVVAGTAFDLNFGGSRVFTWTPGGFQVLAPVGGDNAYAAGISADGTTVVGSSTNANNDSYAAIWRNGTPSSLGPLVGAFSNTATAVSADGSVVGGYSSSAGGHYLALRWTTTGGLQSLAALARGYSNSLAYAVSPNGLLTGGTSSAGGSPAAATLWDATGVAYSLYSLVTAQSGPPNWTFSSIDAISGTNGNYNILGTGILSGTTTETFLLTGLNFTAIPEPSTDSILCGFVALGVVLWWRQRKAA